jgi:hypothetical protein
MYLPKSQIKTNLYTNGGDFILKNSSSPYKGYYYKTSNGRYFSGKTPNESPSFELTKINPNESPTNLSDDLQIENIPTDNYYIIQNEYLNSTFLTFPQIPPSPPKQSYPVPTENDYKLGEFQRYFLKKGNEIKFLEISLEDYRKYINQDRNVIFELYTPIQINWVLTGEKEQVYKINQSIVAKAEQEQNLPGFTQYFRDKFTQFYK